MHTSPAKFLILVALLLVFLVEGRTVLGFFGVEVTPLQTVLVGIVALVALAGWAFVPRPGNE